MREHFRRTSNPPLCALLVGSLILLLANTERAAAQPSSDTPKFAALRHTIAAHDVRSVEELLPLLSPALRSRYVLVFDSRSMQEASLSSPRVLLFGSDARFMISFNGDARQRGFDAIETMEFVEATASFTFREVRFPGFSRSDQDAVEFSESNPARCAVCHGTPARPVWDTFPLWPGVYGERYQRALSGPEAEGLSDFASAQPAHPRYRYLEGFNAEQLRGQLAPTQQRRYSGTLEEPPNAVLSALLGRLSVRVIEQEVQASPHFNDYRYALLWSLHPGCGGVTDAVPTAVAASYRAAITTFAEASSTRTRIHARHKLQRSNAGADSISFASADAAMDGFRYLSEQGLELATRHWALALEQDSNDLTMQESIASQLERRLLLLLGKDDPRLLELHEAAEVSSDAKYCARLRRLSLEAFHHSAPAMAGRSAPTANEESRERVGRTVELSADATGPNASDRCVACHVSSTIGPPIPFDDQSALSGQLRSRASQHGFLLDEILFRLSPQAGNHRMPLNAVLSTEEEQALRQYFLSRAGHK